MAATATLRNPATATISNGRATLVLALCYAVYAILLNSVGTVILQSIINDDSNATKPTDQSPGIKATFKNSQLNGGIQGDDDKRKMFVTLENTIMKGPVNHAGLALEPGSTWTATGNSDLVILKGSLAQIDAPAGVTIQAHTYKDMLAAGTYKLAGGGTLTVAN